MWQDFIRFDPLTHYQEHTLQVIVVVVVVVVCFVVAATAKIMDSHKASRQLEDENIELVKNLQKKLDKGVSFEKVRLVRLLLFEILI